MWSRFATSKPHYPTAEAHAANAPDTWTIEKYPQGNARNRWAIADSSGDILDTFPTKRDAVAARTSGYLADAYAADTRWYAGEDIPGRKSLATVREEQAAAERVKERAALKIGSTQTEIAGWRTALEGLRATEGADNPAPTDEVGLARQSKQLDDAIGAMEVMLGFLTDGGLLNIDYLDRIEAVSAHSELASSWGLASAVEDRIHRIEYLGLDRGKSAIEVLHEMRDEERDAVSVATWQQIAAV